MMFLKYIQLIKPFIKYLWNHKIFLIFLYGLIITGLLVFSYSKYQDLKVEANRYQTNQEALMTDVETFKTESGKNAAKVTQLELTTGEYKKLCSDQLSIIEDLKIKVKNLESVSTTVSETKINVKTSLKDSIIYKKLYKNDTILLTNEKTYYDTLTQQEYVYLPDTIKYFKWNDTWNNIEGQIKGNNVECSYSGIDTLTIAAVKVPKKFLFFKWGCKYIEVNIVNQNPSSKIIFNRTIKFKK